MQQNSLSRYWLILGVAALALAGLFAIALVIGRTPQLASLPFFIRFFHEALVVHVDLSVLVWFLAMACLLLSLGSQGKHQPMPYVEESALICFILGSAALALAPFDPRGQALMSNYIPVIASPVFFMGLALTLCGTSLMLWRFFSACADFALSGAALILLMAIAAFFWSYCQMPHVIDGRQYYDMLFWGGGHVLQLAWAQILMISWAMLTAMAGHGRLFALAFILNVLAALLTPLSYVLYDVSSQEHRLFFTHLMQISGVLPGLLALYLLPGIWRGRGKNALWSALAASVVLFLFGGALGGLITGQNVVIPAHYHGSIVGVTLALMGLAYLLLPQLGYRDPKEWKLAYWQPIVYGAGQLLHISGLAYSGGYGVLRKTPGEIHNIALSVKIALGIMGLGGLIAIIGGLMFVVVATRAIFLSNEISHGSINRT